MKKIFVTLLLAILLIASTTIAWGAVQGEPEMEQQMLDLVNSERVQAGLNPLKMDVQLVELARMKSQDMIEKNYFDHTSPTYGSPFEMMQNYGVDYKMAGENLAGNPTLVGGHEALMDSPGHRANILKPEFTHVGIGVVKGGPYGLMITQMFIKSNGEVTTGQITSKVQKDEPIVSQIEETNKVTKEEQKVKKEIEEAKAIKQEIAKQDTGEKLTVYHANQKMDFPDVQPYINNDDRIMVPLRFVSQELNGQVAWEGTEQKILISQNGDTTLNLWIGKRIVVKNGKFLVTDTAPGLSNSRTMVPLRLVSELLGAKVTWYPTLAKVEIN